MTNQMTFGRTTGARAIGLSTIDRDGRVLEARYLSMALSDVDHGGTKSIDEDELSHELGRSLSGLAWQDVRRRVRIVPVETKIADLSEPARDLNDVYLRLHLLSARRAAPGQVTLSGVLNFFVNVAWTSLGLCLPEHVEELRWLAQIEGHVLTIDSVWPFPRMTDYIVPSGVKIMNAENVRLGAHLAPGTNVLGVGFCNTGSATLGAAAVEGRLSLGVVVGEGSHIGGGASLMGTTSGGGRQVVSIGCNCLVGANAGVGIALGDNCIVEAGCYVTAGIPISLPDGRVVKASELAGQEKLLFRRNAYTGRVEALPSPGWPGLVQQLHS